MKIVQKKKNSQFSKQTESEYCHKNRTLKSVFYSRCVCLYSRGYTWNRPKWLLDIHIKIISHSILGKLFE